MRAKIRKLQFLAWIVVLLGLGTYALTGFALLRELGETDARNAALASGQPAPVAIEAFDPESHLHPQDEVHLRAQIDVAMQYDLVAPSPEGDRLAVMIPLYPASAEDTTAPAEGVMLYDQGPGGETIGQTEIDTLLAQIDGEGGVGPMISLGGQLMGATRYDALVADSFAQAGRAMAADFLVVAPFRTTRAAALGTGPDLEPVLKLGFIAAVFTLIGMILIAFARNRMRKHLAAEQAPEAAPDPEAEGLFEGAPRGAEPEIADTGLVVIGSYAPEMADGSTGGAVMREVLALGRRGEETGTYSARREGIDDFAALDSGGLKRPLPGRGIAPKLAGPKPVKKESPLAGRQDQADMENIMAAVQSEISGGGKPAGPASSETGDIFAAVQAAVRPAAAPKKPAAGTNPAVQAAQNPFGK